MKSIVVYYSYGGNTKRIAQKIQEFLETDVVEIKTVHPYTGSYDDVVEQGHQEVNQGFMPEIEPLEIDFSQYDVIVIGTPVWWYTFAPAVKTFLNSADFSGKEIYPFATNGGWIGHTFQDFQDACNKAKVHQGLNVRFNENMQLTSEEAIQKWTNEI